MRFKDFMENDRQKGRPLNQTGYDLRRVRIYRACEQTVTTFNAMDYVTRSEKFANGHADHQAAVNGEPYHVIAAVVMSKDVYEAYNPGEYFYDGPTVQGQVIYVATP